MQLASVGVFTRRSTAVAAGEWTNVVVMMLQRCNKALETIVSGEDSVSSAKLVHCPVFRNRASVLICLLLGVFIPLQVGSAVQELYVSRQIREQSALAGV